MSGVSQRVKRQFAFGSLAISAGETHGFASRPRGRFAFIEELCLSPAV